MEFKQAISEARANQESYLEETLDMYFTEAQDLIKVMSDPAQQAKALRAAAERLAEEHGYQAQWLQIDTFREIADALDGGEDEEITNVALRAKPF